MFELDDCLAFVTSTSAKIFSQKLEQRLKPYGISRARWIALHHIYRHEVLMQRELADLMAIREPTVGRMVLEMVQDGLVERQASDTDRRANQLVLTKQGQKLYLDMLPIVEQFKEDTTAGIDQADLATISRVLKKMVENSER